MERVEFTEKCKRLLDMEARITKLSAYKPGKMLTRKEAWQPLLRPLLSVLLPALGSYLMWSKALPAIRGASGNLFMGIAVLPIVFILALILSIGTAAMLIITLIHFKALAADIKTACTYRGYNKRMEQRSEQNAASLLEAQQAHKALRDELMEEAASVPHETGPDGEILVNFFFELEFFPEFTATALSMANEQGKSFSKEGILGWSCGAYGDFRFVEDKNGKVRVDGQGKSASACTRERISELLHLPLLYIDTELLEQGKVEDLLIYPIREMRCKELTTNYSITTTTSYGLDEALKDYNEAWDTYEAAFKGNNYGADVYQRASGEKTLRDSLAPVVSESRKTYVTGEMVELLDKGWVVKREGKVACICLPRGGVKMLAFTYELDSHIYQDVMQQKTRYIPKETRFHGKLTGFQKTPCIPDRYSTIAYLAEYWSDEMLPVDFLESQPEGISGSEWRLWIALRYQWREKNYTR